MRRCSARARFEPGEHIGVWAHNLPEWVVLEYGAALAGLTLVTVNPSFQPAEFAYVLGQSKSVGVFLVPEVRGNPLAAHIETVRGDLPELREVLRLDQLGELSAAAPTGRPLPEVGPNDPVQIQYTSGTTGFPKGAVLHHMGVVNNAALWAERVALPDGETYLSPMPLFHTGGCVMGVLGALGRRGTLVLMPGFDPALMLALAESERAGFIGGVPTMIIAAMQHPDLWTRDLSSVRGMVSGGALVPEALVRSIEDTLGVDFTIIYGQTECSPVLTNTFPTDTPEDKGQTVGPPLPHTEVRIVDPVSLETVPVSERGELWARGYFTMIEYFDKPAETADTLLPDGWLRTGDLATMDERGYCRIVGRLKDMIIRGGENLFPAEIEEVLFRHPSGGRGRRGRPPRREVGRGRGGVPSSRRCVGAAERHRAACVPAGATLTTEDPVEVVPRRRVPAHRFGEGPEVRHPRGVGEGPLRPVVARRHVTSAHGPQRQDRGRHRQAAGGIGSAIVRALVGAGARLVVATDIVAPTSTDSKVLPRALDVTDQAATSALVEEIESGHGPVDLWFANAGVSGGGQYDAPDSTWTQQWQVNVMAHVYAHPGAHAGMASRAAKGISSRRRRWPAS